MVDERHHHSPPRRTSQSSQSQSRSAQSAPREPLKWCPHVDFGAIHQPSCSICNNFQHHSSDTLINSPDYRRMDQAQQMAQAMAGSSTSCEDRNWDSMQAEVDRMRSVRNRYRVNSLRLEEENRDLRARLQQLKQVQGTSSQSMDVDPVPEGIGRPPTHQRAPPLHDRITDPPLPSTLR